jgi:hypothetical protein
MHDDMDGKKKKQSHTTEQETAQTKHMNIFSLKRINNKKRRYVCLCARINK